MPNNEIVVADEAIEVAEITTGEDSNEVAPVPGTSEKYSVGLRTRIRVGKDSSGEDVVIPIVIRNVLDLREKGMQVHYREGEAPLDLGTVDQFYATIREDFHDLAPLPEFSFSRDLPEALRPIGGIRTTIHEMRLATGSFNDGKVGFRVVAKFTPEKGTVHLPGLKQIYLQDCMLRVQIGAFADEPQDVRWWEESGGKEPGDEPGDEPRDEPGDEPGDEPVAEEEMPVEA